MPAQGVSDAYFGPARAPALTVFHACLASCLRQARRRRQGGPAGGGLPVAAKWPI